jgi:glycosyltransferase involved in cell wall biosynthesis
MEHTTTVGEVRNVVSTEGKQMRIAIIGSRGLLSEYSGIEATLREICPRLARRGHAVTVFGEESAESCIDGVSLDAVAAFGGKHLETLSRSLAATRRALAGRFDLIHFHDAGPGVYSTITRLWRVPSVLTLHSLDWQRDKWSAPAKLGIRLIEKVAVRNVNRITVVSEPLRAYLVTEYRRQSIVLPNVVEPRPHVPATSFSAQFGLSDRQYVLFVGRLVKEKAPHMLIDAFRTLKTNMKLVVAGQDRYEERYAHDLRRIAEGTGIVFTGHVPADQIGELYSNAYLFVLPSRVEGCSMALLEAIAHGTPALVSNIPENLHAIAGDGFTFEVGNSVDLALQFKRLIANPGEVESMRRKLARRRAVAPSWDMIVERYEGVYEAALGR